jgi:hypothetical protein
MALQECAEPGELEKLNLFAQGANKGLAGEDMVRRDYNERCLVFLYRQPRSNQKILKPMLTLFAGFPTLPAVLEP